MALEDGEKIRRVPDSTYLAEAREFTLEGGSMVVVMQERATEEQIEKVVASLVEIGLDVHRSTGVSRTVLGAVGDDRRLDPRLIEILDGVSEVLRVTAPYKLASRAFRPEGTVVTMDDVRIGGDEVIVMAGPCSAETEEQVNVTAAAVKRAGAKMLRGGAFKPRSSPYSFQGLGEEGLRMLRAAASEHDLKLVSEVMDVSQIPRHREVLRHVPGRRAEHAELHAAPRARTHAQTGAAEARHLRHDRGVAAVGRIRAVGRQRAT